MVPSGATDWFGHPLPPRDGGAVEPVPCPRCGEGFVTPADLRDHLAEEHRVRFRPHRQRAARLQRWWDSLGYLPLWYIIPLDLLAVVIVGGLLWQIDAMLALFAAGLTTFPLVLVLSHRIFRRPV